MPILVDTRVAAHQVVDPCFHVLWRGQHHVDGERGVGGVGKSRLFALEELLKDEPVKAALRFEQEGGSGQAGGRSLVAQPAPVSITNEGPWVSPQELQTCDAGRWRRGRRRLCGTSRDTRRCTSAGWWRRSTERGGVREHHAVDTCDALVHTALTQAPQRHHSSGSTPSYKNSCTSQRNAKAAVRRCEPEKTHSAEGAECRMISQRLQREGGFESRGARLSLSSAQLRSRPHQRLRTATEGGKEAPAAPLRTQAVTRSQQDSKQRSTYRIASSHPSCPSPPLSLPALLPRHPLTTPPSPLLQHAVSVTAVVIAFSTVVDHLRDRSSTPSLFISLCHLCLPLIHCSTLSLCLLLTATAMPASEQVKAAQRQELSVSKPPAAAPPLFLTSCSLSSSSALTVASTSPRPFLFHALPPVAADALQGYLGFTLLMDLRVLSSSACRWQEDEALQWMNHNLIDVHRDSYYLPGWYDSDTDFDSHGGHYDLKSEDGGSGEEDASDAPPSAPVTPFCFTHDDVVWFRQQLSRWGAGCGREDSERCTISPVDAHVAYDIPWASTRPHQPLSIASLEAPVASVSSLEAPERSLLSLTYLVRHVARHLFHGRYGQEMRHATAFAQQLQEGAAQRSSGLSDRAYRQMLAREKRTARRWKEGGPLPAPLMLMLPLDAHDSVLTFLTFEELLLLPAAVAQHTVLSFLVFDEVMQLRVLSHALQPVLEAAAVAQLNRLCPSGLATIARQEQEAVETAMQLAEKARAHGQKDKEKAQKKKHKEEREKKETKRSRKRKRADEPAPSPVSAAPSAPALPSPAASSSSSSSSSSPAASSSPASPSASPPASYTVAHCVWAMQQLQWCRRLDFNGRRQMQRPRALVVPLLCKTHFHSRFSRRAQWTQRFPPSAPASGQGTGKERVDFFDALDVVLGVDGRHIGRSRQRKRQAQRGDAAVEVRLGQLVRRPLIAGCPTLLSIFGSRRCQRCRLIQVGSPSTSPAQLLP